MERQQEQSTAGAGRAPTERARPEGRPADDRKKERANAVYATSGGKVFEIPLDIAQKYAVSADRAKELQCLTPQGIGEEESEVGGRDIRFLQSGRFGYHSNWAYGPYIWWRDGGVYRGWHWHPNVNNPLAYDTDD
jgi:hypothetical protein